VAKGSKQAPMTRTTLLRACLGCGVLVRGKPRCTDCQRRHNRPRDQARAARRPDRKT